MSEFIMIHGMSCCGIRACCEVWCCGDAECLAGDDGVEACVGRGGRAVSCSCM